MDEYKTADLTISKLCVDMSDMRLVCLDGKTLYKDLEFQQDQQMHQHNQLIRIKAAHQEVIDIMRRVYQTFCKDGPEVCVCV